MLLRGDPRPTYARKNLRETSVKTANFSFRDSNNQRNSRARRNPQKYPKQSRRFYRKMAVGWKIKRGRLHLPKEKEEIGTQEQNVNGYQSPSRKPSLQPRKQIDRRNKHNQSLYWRDNTGIVIPVPIRNRAFKDEIGERKEMMMSVVVMRYKVETAMEKHAPRKNDNPLGVP